MKKSNLLLIIAITLIIFGLIYIYEPEIGLSPSEKQKTPENLFEFALWQQNQLQDNFEQENIDLPEKEEENQCASSSDSCCINKCETIVSDALIMSDPLNNNLLDWIAYFNGHRVEIEEIGTNHFWRIIDFIVSIQCPEGCSRKIEKAESTTLVEVENPEQNECSSNEKTATLSATGINILGSCELAANDAFNKMRKKLENLRDSCGKECSANFEIPTDDLIFDIVEEIINCRENQRGLVRRVNVNMELKYNCVGEPENDMYRWITKTNVCVKCSTPIALPVMHPITS